MGKLLLCSEIIGTLLVWLKYWVHYWCLYFGSRGYFLCNGFLFLRSSGFSLRAQLVLEPVLCKFVQDSDGLFTIITLQKVSYLVAIICLYSIQFKNVLSQLQWGSEIQTCPDFEWPKVGRFSNAIWKPDILTILFKLKNYFSI